MIHIVKKGDTLSSIARDVNKKYPNKNVTVQNIVNWNKNYYPSLATNPDLIHTGWELYLPVDGQRDTRPNKMDPKNHTHPAIEKQGTIVGDSTKKVGLREHCMSSRVIYEVKGGDKVTVIYKCEDMGNSLYFIKSPQGVKGWVPKSAVELEKEVTKPAAEKPAAKPKDTNANNSSVSEGVKDTTEKDKEYADISDLLNSITAVSGKTNVSYNDLLIDDCVGIHCMPYQFMDDVDTRLSEEIKFGRTYIDRIITKMPLLLLTPGRANYMPAYSDDDKKTVITALLQKVQDGKDTIEKNLQKLLSDTVDGASNHRYYTFEFRHREYYFYVDKLLRYCAVCLGLQDYQYAAHGENKSHALGTYSWEYATNEKLKGFLSSAESVAFYIDAETSISEDISSSTTHSQLGDAFNSVRDYAREVQFLLGPIAGVDFIAKNMDSSTYESTASELFSSVDEALGVTFFDRFAKGFETVAKGGKLLFPEIWDDTEFSKSYSVDFKLRTPDGDKLSWYLNICVPLMHLLAFAAPREMGVNGYMSPFLCRAYYKGLFNIDMGIITSMSINKGKEGSWTVDGLPTEVDVSISIKELYQTLSLSGGQEYTLLESPGKFFKNTALIDYLSTTCGININKPELSRILEAYKLFALNAFTDTYHGLWTGLSEKATNTVVDVYNALTFRR